MKKAAVLVSIFVPAVFAPASVHAHDPFQITADAHLFPDRLDLRVTMARTTAARACPGAPSEACARTLHLVADGGRALVASAARANMTAEGDFDMELTYPPPGEGPLHIEALFLARLGDATFGETLTVTATGAFLGQQLLRADDPTFEVALPSGPARPPPLGVPRGLVLLGALAAALALGWLARRARARVSDRS